MEGNFSGRRKGEPSIPGNYLSILELQQQWLKAKERRQKEREEEEEEQRRNQQLEEQRRREKDREKVEAEKRLKEVGKGVERRKLDEKGVDLRNRRLSSRNRWRKKHGVGGQAIREKGVESEVVAIVGENGEETTPGDERLREVGTKKKKSSKRKKNQARVKEDLIGGETCAPLLNKPIPSSNEIRGVYKPKLEKATGERDAPHRENSSKDLTAEIEKKIEGITIESREGRGDTRTSKSSARLNRQNYSNWENDRHYRRPLRWSALKGPMNAKLVWVKKEQTEGDAGGSGSANL